MRSRALGVLLLAALLFGKALVPAGWMPAQDARGFAIRLCSGQGPTEAWVDASGHLKFGSAARNDAPEGKVAKDPCPYAALAMAARLPLAPEIAAAPLTPAPVAALPLAEVSVGRGLAAPPPLPTGPPRFA